jgi:hypothetical protein
VLGGLSDNISSIIKSLGRKEKFPALLVFIAAAVVVILFIVAYNSTTPPDGTQTAGILVLVIILIFGGIFLYRISPKGIIDSEQRLTIRVLSKDGQLVVGARVIVGESSDNTNEYGIATPRYPSNKHAAIKIRVDKESYKSVEKVIPYKQRAETIEIELILDQRRVVAKQLQFYVEDKLAEIALDEVQIVFDMAQRPRRLTDVQGIAEFDNIPAIGTKFIVTRDDYKKYEAQLSNEQLEKRYISVGLMPEQHREMTIMVLRNKKPVQGATVTLFTNPQKNDDTDRDGIVKFTTYGRLGANTSCEVLVGKTLKKSIFTDNDIRNGRPQTIEMDVQSNIMPWLLAMILIVLGSVAGYMLGLNPSTSTVEITLTRPVFVTTPVANTPDPNPPVAPSSTPSSKQDAVVPPSSSQVIVMVSNPSPIEVVDTYWDLVTNHQYEEAWNWLTRDFQDIEHNNSFDHYRYGFENWHRPPLCSIDASNLELSEQTGREASVMTTLAFRAGVSCAESLLDYEIVLHYEDGNWKINTLIRQ